MSMIMRKWLVVSWLCGMGAFALWPHDLHGQARGASALPPARQQKSQHQGARSMKVEVYYQFALKGNRGGTRTTRVVEVAFPSHAAIKDALAVYHSPRDYDITILGTKVKP